MRYATMTERSLDRIDAFPLPVMQQCLDGTISRGIKNMEAPVETPSATPLRAFYQVPADASFGPAIMDIVSIIPASSTRASLRVSGRNLDAKVFDDVEAGAGYVKVDIERSDILITVGGTDVRLLVLKPANPDVKSLTVLVLYDDYIVVRQRSKITAHSE